MSSLSNYELVELEMKALTELQRSFYFPDKKDDTSEEIQSFFLKRPIKRGWCSSFIAKLPSEESSGSITYIANNTLDRLEGIGIEVNLKPLRIKKDYIGKVQIRWVHNVLHEILGICSVCQDEQLITTIDPIWRNIYLQYWCKNRQTRKEGIGSIPMLEQWNSSLPAYRLTMQECLPFSEDTSLSYPLFLLPPTSRLMFRYNVCLDISKLLRMRIFDSETQTWQEIRCNLKYVDGAGTLGRLDIPTIYGYYSSPTKDEKDWWICEGQTKPHSISINHIISVNSLNPFPFGSKVSVELNCNGPCKSLFWVAQNSNYPRLNILSNYTTQDEIIEGWSPWNHYSIIYKGSIVKSDHVSYETALRINAPRHCRKTPFEHGYGMHSFTFDPLSLDREITIAPNNLGAKLVIELNDTNPLNNELKEEEEERNPLLDSQIQEIGPRYLIHIRLLCLRKLEFHYNNTTNYFSLKIVDM